MALVLRLESTLLDGVGRTFHRIPAMKHLLITAALLLITHSPALFAKQIVDFTLPNDTDLELRTYPSNGDTLLLGFACDEGMGSNQEDTAAALAQDGIEVWMPDMLGAYMLPNLKSSSKKIPTDSLLALIDAALKTNKKVYLIAGGSETELILRAAAEWENDHLESKGKNKLRGAILLFPRVIDGKPVPGEEPKYVQSVGKTKLPLMLLEGERTPNRWGVSHLTNALQQSGSDVFAKLIPNVRGYFFNRGDANAPEELVTSQLSGLIKASLYFLDGAHHEAE